jgi:tetratricopeptide (TPR) repeat protein
MQSLGLPSQSWQNRIRNAEGECYRLAGESAFREKRFEEGLEFSLRSARLLDKDEMECRSHAQEIILGEIRSQFAAPSNNRDVQKSPPSKDETLLKLIEFVNQLQSPCPEALFWQALGRVREGRIDLALASLEQSRAVNGQPAFDPSFYLGILLYREGRIAEALRHLADANRMGPECPLVPWQLGLVMVAEGSKDTLAIRPLQKALGPNGLAAWIRCPGKLWQETLPDRQRCYVRRLPEDLNFNCPVLGTDVPAMIRQGQAALAQAQYRLGNLAEAADLYNAVLRESPPSLQITRGLGLSLARLERYDEAFKHLRAAYDLEQRRDAKGANSLTAGYLALCGAKGTPSRPEDKPKNILWAIRTLTSFDNPGDRELAQLYNAVFSEARAAGIAVPIADQIRLCDVLASVEATDAPAAAAYLDLSKTSPDDLRAEHAWLYCRAVEQHHFENQNDIEVFRRAFADERALRGFFEKHGWDLNEVEFIFMSRCATETPSGRVGIQLPDSLRQKAEYFLLTRSEQMEQAGRTAEALDCLKKLLRLVPQSWPAQDRLARMHYRTGNLDAAFEILAARHNHDPNDSLLLIRKAVIDQQRGRIEDCLGSIRKALQLTSRRQRGSIALLGSRLALASSQFQHALEFLQECLREDPDELTALWISAAIRYLLGDQDGLASQAKCMNRPDAADPRFQYFAAIAFLTAGHLDQALEAANRAHHSPSWVPSSIEAAECGFLVALVNLQRNDWATASVELQRIIDSSMNPPCVDHARAHLARIRYSRGSLEDSIRLWNDLDSAHLKNWQLENSLRRTILLAGVQSLKAGQFEQAAGFFRDLNRIDRDEPAYLRLLTHALAEAGRSYQSQSDYHTAARFFEEALTRSSSNSNVAHDLASIYKRLGKFSEARKALQSVVPNRSDMFYEMGLLSLEEKRLAQAEKDFARAWGEEPSSFEASYNLAFTRLSLGEVDQALELFPDLMKLANKDEDQAYLSRLYQVLQITPSQNGQQPDYGDLESLNPEEEQQILNLSRQLGHIPTATRLIRALAAVRGESPSHHLAIMETALVQAKQSLGWCNWLEATRLLTPWAEVNDGASRPIRAALLNLLGCCACLNQDFEAGIHYFSAALQLVNRDARMSQNLALAYELQGRLAEAESHWNWYLEMLDDHIPAPPDSPGYKNRLTFECLHRLGVRFSEKGKNTSALAFLQRAHQLRPADTDTLERLFHVFLQQKRPEDARRALRRLKQLRPEDLQNELFEVDLIEINSLDNCNRVLAGLEALQRKSPDDGRVFERQAHLLNSVISYLKRLCRQISAQLERAVSRVRRLPPYQVDWPEMKHYLRDLRSRLQRIRKTAERSLPLAASDLVRQNVQEIIRQADRDIEQCRNLVRSRVEKER